MLLIYLHIKIKICDQSRKNVAYVEIINYEKTLILTNLQKFGDYHFLAFLHCVMTILQVDVYFQKKLSSSRG